MGTARLWVEVSDWDARDASWGWSGDDLPGGFRSDDLVRFAIEVLEQHLNGDDPDVESLSGSSP